MTAEDLLIQWQRFERLLKRGVEPVLLGISYILCVKSDFPCKNKRIAR